MGGGRKAVIKELQREDPVESWYDWGSAVDAKC